MRKMHRDMDAPESRDPAQHAIADTPRTRPCLCCGVAFDSSGFGERICRRCKSTSAWRDGNAGGSSRK